MRRFLEERISSKDFDHIEYNDMSDKVNTVFDFTDLFVSLDDYQLLVDLEEIIKNNKDALPDDVVDFAERLKKERETLTKLATPPGRALMTVLAAMATLYGKKFDPKGIVGGVGRFWPEWHSFGFSWDDPVKVD